MRYTKSGVKASPLASPVAIARRRSAVRALTMLVSAAALVCAVWWYGFGPILAPQDRLAVERVDTEKMWVLPTGIAYADSVRAPIAWIQSRGEGVRVAAVNATAADELAFTHIAPASTLIRLDADPKNPAGLADLAISEGVQSVCISMPESFAQRALRSEISRMLSAGIAVFISGDTAQSRADVRFANRLELAGAITVGRFDTQGVVVDEMVRTRRVNLYAVGSPDNPRIAPIAAAAVGALVAEHTRRTAQETSPVTNPGPGWVSPKALKAQLIRSSIPRWQMTDPTGGRFIRFTRTDRDGHWLPRRMLFRSPFTYRQLDAARAVGVDLANPWFLDALNIDEAHSLATGAGTRIALIDQGFELENSTLKGRVAAKAAFGGADFSVDKHPHGTEMAEVALAVAPDADVILVLCRCTEDERESASYVAEGIDFAVAHGADVISMSFGPFARTKEVYQAINRAIDAGVSVVWFNYDGRASAVIRPEPYAERGGDFGVFTRTFDRYSPAEISSGRSAGSPQAAGVVALLKEVHPTWTPAQIKAAMVGSAFSLETGRKILHAAAALE